MTAYSCGNFPCKSYCFAGNNTRGNQKNMPDSDLLYACAPTHQCACIPGCKPRPVRGELGRLLKSKLSPRQWVHQNSAWTGPVTYTLNGHLRAVWQEAALGRSPVPSCTAAQGRRQPGRQPCQCRGQDACTQRSLVQTGTDSVIPPRLETSSFHLNLCML